MRPRGEGASLRPRGGASERPLGEAPTLYSAGTESFVRELSTLVIISRTLQSLICMRFGADLQHDKSNKTLLTSERSSSRFKVNSLYCKSPELRNNTVVI